MRVHAVRALFVTPLLALLLGILAIPAGAACHIASFFSTDLSGAEGGTVDVVVELRGRQPSCAGTVDYETVDQSAVAGEDYEAASGTLTFETGDDREETITLTLLADDQAEGDEDFRVELLNPTGGISGTSGPAIVVITGDGGAEEPAEEDAETDDATGGGAESAEPEAAEPEAADDGGVPVVPLVIVGLLAVGAVAFFMLRGRGA